MGVHVAYYRAQNAERKLVNSLNGLVSYNERQWTERGRGTVAVDGATLRAAQIIGPDRGAGVRRDEFVVWHGYWVDGRVVASDLQAKLAGASSRLRGHGDDGAVLVLYADEGSPAASEAAVRAFVAANLRTLTAVLQRTHDAR